MTKEQQVDERGALARYTALDLTDDKGYQCGRILASLGAKVIKIEPPGGDQGGGPLDVGPRMV